MIKTPSKEENPNGLHIRYNITKADGTPVDPNAEYFVLRLDYGGKDENHIRACRVAINAYSLAIQTHIPKLADDIRHKYGWESVELAPFSLLDYVREYEMIIKKIIPIYEKNLRHIRHGSAAEKIDSILSQFKNIADSAIYQAKDFIDDVKTQFKAIEIIVEGLTDEGMNHGQKRVVANHVISTIRRMIDRINRINWEYTDRIYERYDWFRSDSPEKNLMERYRNLKREFDSVKTELSKLQNKTNGVVKDNDEIPF